MCVEAGEKEGNPPAPSPSQDAQPTGDGGITWPGSREEGAAMRQSGTENVRVYAVCPCYLTVDERSWTATAFLC